MFSPKAILFDFGGTLDANGVHWLDRVFPLYAQAGVDVPRERFVPAFYESDDTLPVRHNLRGLGFEATMKLQVERVLSNLGLSSAAAPMVVGRFLADSRAEFARNRPLLEELRKQGRRLGIVSNFYGNLESILHGEGLRELFDVVVDSGVVGVEKPDPRIFREAMEALGIDARDTLMVGDSRARDMRGAEGLGMPHAWLVGDRAEEPCCPNGIVIRALSELRRRLC